MDGIVKLGNRVSIPKIYSLWAEHRIIDYTNIVFDLSDLRFIDVCSIVLLSHVINDFRSETVSISIEQPKSNDVHTYLARMNFYKLVGVDIAESFQRHNEDGRFLPLCTVDNSYDDVNAVSMKLYSIMFFNCEYGEGLSKTIVKALNELLDNVNEHAGRQSNSVVAAQTYSGNNTIAISISDLGIGIPNSLRKNVLYKDLSDEQALLKVWEKGVGDGKGVGHGLYFIARFIEMTDSYLVVYSGNAMTSIDSSGISTSKSEHHYQGTFYSITINTASTADLDEVNESSDPDDLPYFNEQSIEDMKKEAEDNQLW